MYKKHVDGRDLDLSMSNLAEVSTRDIKAFTKVDTIDLSCNNLEYLPEDFGDLAEQVIRLDLSKNRLTQLPVSFGKLRSLQHLDLRGNRLRLLPPSFANLERLRWLDLKDNDELEPGLAKAAGNCLDERACRQCASSVVAHMRQVSAGLERERQARLAEARAATATREAREAADRAEKRDAKKLRRRQVAQEKQQQQRRSDAELDDDGLRKLDETDGAGSEAEEVPSRGCCRRLAPLLAVSLLLLLLLLLVVGAVACVDLAWQPVGDSVLAGHLQPACRRLLPLLPESAIHAASWLLASLPPMFSAG